MATTADRVVVELIAKIDGYEAAIRGAGATTDVAMSSVERAASKAEASIMRMSQSTQRNAASAANATRNLGRQVADVGVGLAGGQSPFLILAQQAPQVADALADTGGKAAKVASFFAGPWGAALLAAGSALGVLLGKALETEGGVDELVAKLEEQAKRAAASAQADRIFAGTQAGLSAKIRETTIALAAQNATLRTNAQLRNIQARSQLVADEAKVAAANNRLSNARRAVGETSAQGGTRGEVGTERAIARARAANAELQEATRAAREAGQNYNVSKVYLAIENATASATAVGKVTKAYDDQIQALERRAVVEARSGKQIGTFTQQQIERLVRQKNAAIEAAQATERATGGGGRTRSGGGRAAVRSRAMSSAAVEPFVFSAEYINNDAAFERLQEDARKAGERAAQAFREVFGSGDALGDGVKDYDRERDARLTAYVDAERQAQDVREANVRQLAGTFEDLFRGGTDAVWSNFKEQGLRTLAIILAQSAIQSFGQGGNGGGSFFKNLASGLQSAFGSGSVPGRASGGYVGPGQTVRVNEGRSSGVELLRMGPQGGTVIPLGQTRAASRSGPAVVHQHFTLDLRGGMTTPQLLAGVKTYVDGRAAEATNAAYTSAVRDTPARIQRERPLKL